MLNNFLKYGFEKMSITIQPTSSSASTTFSGSKFLDLSRPVLREDEILAKIELNSLQIEQMSLEGQRFLTDTGLGTIATKCKNLKMLNLSQCSNITCKGLSDLLGNCLDLNSLDLRNCNLAGDYLELLNKHASLSVVVLPNGTKKIFNDQPGLITDLSLSFDRLFSREQKQEEGKRATPPKTYTESPNLSMFKGSHRSNRGIWKILVLDDLIITGSYDSRIGLWNSKTLKLVKFLPPVHKKEILALKRIHHKSGLFLSGSADGTMVMWNNDFKPIITYLGHITGVYSIAQLQSGAFVTGSRQIPKESRSWKYDIVVWNPETKKIMSRLKGHEGAISALDVMVSGLLASGSADHTVKIWDTSKGTCLRTINKHKDYVYCTISLGAGLLASGSRDKTILLTDTVKNKTQTLSGHMSTVYSVARVTEQFIVSASRDGTHRIWDLQTGNCVQMMEHTTTYIYSVATGLSGEIYAGLSTGQLAKWEFPTEK